MSEARSKAEPRIDPTSHVVRSSLGRYTDVGARTKVVESSFGDYSYIVNDGDVIYTTVGKFCSIAAHVRINPGNHPQWRASQSHFTYRASRYFDETEDESEFFEWRRQHACTIGHDVWIGHGVVVLAGRKIGTGSIIAAGAVVSRDVAPYEIVGGVPSKVIKRRFPEKISDALLELSWWDWEHDRLKAALNDFRMMPVEAFVEKHQA